MLGLPRGKVGGTYILLLGVLLEDACDEPRDGVPAHVLELEAGESVLEGVARGGGGWQEAALGLVLGVRGEGRWGIGWLLEVRLYRGDWCRVTSDRRAEFLPIDRDRGGMQGGEDVEIGPARWIGWLAVWCVGRLVCRSIDC